MQAVTKSEARTCLRQSGFPSIFDALYESSSSVPFNLDIYCGCPEEFFITPAKQVPYTGGRLVPILDDGNFDSVTFVDPDTNAFVIKSIEEPNTERERFESLQQVVATILIRMGEADVDDDALRAAAGEMQFPKIDALIEFLNSADAHEDYHANRSAFLAKIGR